ncbi:MAG: transcriptional repressor [Clostridia bacterium]|nr:transcriptional repressor [Clostridia bacterium]
MTKRNTLQKGIVSDIFSSMTNHPSAGMVYDAVHEKYPGISRATVYRILAEAAEEGVIQRLKLCEANDRFDVTLGKHYHVTCKKCKAVADVIVDLDMEGVERNAEGCQGFLVEDCHVEFFGICEECRKKQSN